MPSPCQGNVFEWLNIEREWEVETSYFIEPQSEEEWGGGFPQRGMVSGHEQQERKTIEHRRWKEAVIKDKIGSSAKSPQTLSFTSSQQEAVKY